MASKTPQQTTIPIEGMHCASCVLRVEDSLKKVPGVSKVAVNLATEQATVAFDPEVSALDSLYRAIQDAGYHPRPEAAETPTLQEEIHEREERLLWRKLLFAGVLGGILVVLGQYQHFPLVSRLPMAAMTVSSFLLAPPGE